MYICVGNLTIIGSDNGLLPGWRQAITWTNVGILLIGPLEKYFSEMLIDIHTFLFKKIHLKVSSGKWQPFCLCLNVLNIIKKWSENMTKIKFCQMLPLYHHCRLFSIFIDINIVNVKVMTTLSKMEDEAKLWGQISSLYKYYWIGIYIYTLWANNICVDITGSEIPILSLPCWTIIDI